MKKLLVVSAVVGLLSGCMLFGGGESDRGPVVRDENGVALNRIPGTNSVDIPAGISDSQALDAVELAINGTSPGERNNSWVSKWRPEARDENNKWIRIGLHARKHYLCVCYRIEGGKLVPDVPTSTNLKQNGTSIHRKVPLWINDFNTLITTQMYGLKNGSNCAGTKIATKKAEARKAEAEATIAEAQAAAVVNGGEAAAKRFCENCGSKVGEAAKFCGSCGQKL